MRNAVLALITLLVGSAAAPAQTQQWANKLFAKPHGEGTSHDFGSIPRGAVVTHRFPLKNIYAVPLEIIGTRVSCGCVTITSTLQVLKSRETGAIEVTMDARRFTGLKTVNIFVTVGPQFTSTATLTVSANSRADVVLNPGQINFGVVERGDRSTQTIEVEYAGRLDWHVSGVAKHALPVETKVEEFYRERGRVGYRLHVTLRPDAPAGPLKQELSLQTNDPASPLVPVLIEATIQAPLSVKPSSVSLGMVKLGEEITRSVVVHGQKPFKILSIDGQGDGISAGLPDKTAHVHILTIRCAPTKPGDFKKTLQIETNMEKEAAVSVTVEGTATTNP